MEAIGYESGGKELLPRVKPLWEKLNWHHLLTSIYFKHHYSVFTFDGRQKRFLNESIRLLYVDLAHDQKHRQDVGYCITSVSREDVGEIESIYVDAEYRKLGLGDQLMKRAMVWLDDQGVTARTLSVSVGNDDVLPFYQRYGFYPRKIVLEYIPPEKKMNES